jgi:hypothetical protein
LFEKERQYVCPEKVADTAFPIFVPSLFLLNGVRPKQVAEHALVGDVGGTVESEDFLDFG